ncbi:hypothetical protein J7T55_001348 [Diaporthe amygdali]|uniref:uncharacterized protein n=1 Tax=Phomopsis amygdali TaxID=1214568 RepID=UPI0022FDEFB7|nr:uncharacterized protein J7T55_001348 [Diaporthe amygdali]KAJ0106824.1 hypothetical protein J7T55_001348 [Diaporthe amygdali]
MDDLSRLLELPDELLGAIVCYIPAAADTAAFGLTCRRLRKVVCTSPVWRQHCITTWRHWDPQYELPAKLTQPPLQTDWRQLFLQRVNDDLAAALLFQDLVSTQQKRLHRMHEIAEKGLNVQDLVLNLRNRTPDEAEDVLARRWHADAILRMMHRSRAVEVWRRFQLGDEITTEEALCAFDMFVLGNGLGDFSTVERRFDSIAQSIRDQDADFDDKTVRQKALLIAGFLWSDGLVGMPALQPDEANYHALRNNFITLALLSPIHASLPLQSVAIYCAVARRLGVIATPSNFPRHVHAVVQAPPDQTLDGQPKSTDTGPEFLHVDTWQQPHQLHEDQLRLRLLQTGIPAGNHDQQLGPADGRDTLIRASRNILVSVNNARLHHEGGDTPPHEHPYAPDPATAQYGAFWAMSLLVDSDAGLAPQRREFLQVLLQQFHNQFPEDFAIIQNLILPMLQGAPEYQRMVEFIDSIIEDDSEPKEQKLRGAQGAGVQYRIGHYFEHRHYSYKGFIVGWDAQCEAGSGWIERMQVDNLPRGRHQPFYNIIAEDKSHRYVAEENIQILKQQPTEALLQLAGRYFKRWDDHENKFVSNIRDQYPDD